MFGTIDELFCLSSMKGYLILHIVYFCIKFGILYGLIYDFYSNYVFTFFLFEKKESNTSCSAVEVENCFLFRCDTVTYRLEEYVCTMSVCLKK